MLDHTFPGNYAGFGPTTTVTCTGAVLATCFVTVHANGVLPDGRLTTPGTWGASATPFVSSELRTVDGGRTWQPLHLPDGAWTSTAFSCAGPSNCAVGALVRAHSFLHVTPVVFTTSDGGRRWALRHLPRSAGLLRALACPEPAVCVALTWTPSATRVDGMTWLNGADQVFPSELFVTRDAGRSWARLSLPATPSGDVYSLDAMSCPTIGHCVLEGRRTHIDVVPGPFTGPDHTPVYRRGRSQTVVVALDTLRGRGTVGVHPAGPLACSSAQRCLMVTPSAGAGAGAGAGANAVYSSSNGGRTWTLLSAHGLPPSTGWRSLQCVSWRGCLAIGTTAATTNDGGRRWTAGPSLGSASCTASGTCVGLQPVGARDPYMPRGHGTVGATRILTNARRT